MKHESNTLKTMALAGLLGLTVAGCEEVDLVVPSADQVESLYTIPAESSVSMNGNVAELTVYQGSRQLRRGGTLWAKVGPYIYLLTPATQEAFEQYSGLAGVRVITKAPGGAEVARAMLKRDALNEVTWARALNIAGRARRDGGERVALLEDLVRYGEDRTEHEYSSAYVRQR